MIGMAVELPFDANPVVRGDQTPCTGRNFGFIVKTNSPPTDNHSLQPQWSKRAHGGSGLWAQRAAVILYREA